MAAGVARNVRVDIWTDINCPFCYLGKARFERALGEFAQREQVEVVHRSFELDPTLGPEETGPVVAKIASKYGISEAQAAANERGIGAQAGELGLTYLTEGRDFGNSFDMHRLLHFAHEQGRQADLLDALYRANFADARPAFGSAERLVEIAADAGFDAAAVRAVLADPTAYADAVRADETEASRLGITGVPFFVFDGKYAVSGAQPPAVFTQALTQGWSTHQPTLQPIGASDETCGPDGCELPSRD
ncbi:putative DsbA family dithiol-disulfide isomerase [Nocardia puris]|uniref:Putative DsbA family dithiol-disulfide isomerase n=1 Tax=Nocardia puris TaxID=208602 RepID=A0A366DFH3_9NOCA|nr:putative DsbA family dithiol-disulfide isomerase [Nocardia puris]